MRIRPHAHTPGRWVACIILVAAVGALFTHCRSDQVPVTGSPVRVVGTLALGGTQESALTDVIALPDITVSLRDAETNADLDQSRTLLNGDFALNAPRPGTYRVCWEVPGERGCGDRFVAETPTAWAGFVAVRTAHPFIHGTAVAGDGRPCWLNDAFFEIDLATRITAQGLTGAATASTRANIDGHYVIFGLPPGRYRLRAECEKATAEATTSLGGAPVVVDLPLPNRSPRFVGVAAFAGGQAIATAGLGAAIEIRATGRDADGDTLEYLWRANDGSSPVALGTTDRQSWTTPGHPGLFQAYVMARDGKGGYAFRHLSLPVGTGDLAFSGVVFDESTGAPVINADVSVGGGAVTARTNTQGWFRLFTPVTADARYVINIHHPDYSLGSRVFDRSAESESYALIRAQTQAVSLTEPLAITDTTPARECERNGQHAVRRLVPPTVVDPDATISPTNGATADEQHRLAREILARVTRQEHQCDPRGAEVIVPASALAAGAPGAVTATIATIDPARRSIPGDYQATNAAGERVELLSFGAVSVEFRDAAGRALNLATGQAAEIRMPVSDAERPNAPPTIDLWSYNEESGRWVAEGTATLTQRPNGWFYVGKTSHFSAINMDVGGNDPAGATCVRVELDSAFGPWTNKVLRAYVSFNGDQVQVKEVAVDNEQYHAIYRIPYKQSPVPTTLRLELRGTFQGQTVVLLDNIINTDARPQMQFDPSDPDALWPPYDYEECGAPIVLSPAPGVIPYYGSTDASGRPAFLTGPYGDFNPPNGNQVAVDYYAATSAPATLGAWWTAHGFGADGSGGVRAAYLNHNDLGFGRDMHCLASGSNLACYVTNYGLPDQEPSNADAAEGQDPTKRGATVAMTYKASASTDKRVQFVVYGGGVAGSARINFADLDGFGPKSVPHLCLVCHGGPPTLDANQATHARFREFDLPSFRYSGNRSWDYPPGAQSDTLTTGELAAFAQLNEMVRNVGLNPSPIRSLIDAWYPGGFGGSPKPVNPPAPLPGWAGQQTAYHDVYGRSCRTCHVARDEGNPNNFYVFNKYSQFQGTDYAVCGSGNPKARVMPNAVVTYKNFWADTPRVQQFEIITSVAPDTCDDN